MYSSYGLAWIYRQWAKLYLSLSWPLPLFVCYIYIYIFNHSLSLRGSLIADYPSLRPLFDQTIYSPTMYFLCYMHALSLLNRSAWWLSWSKMHTSTSSLWEAILFWWAVICYTHWFINAHVCTSNGPNHFISAIQAYKCKCTHARTHPHPHTSTHTSIYRYYSHSALSSLHYLPLKDASIRRIAKDIFVTWGDICDSNILLIWEGNQYSIYVGPIKTIIWLLFA